MASSSRNSLRNLLVRAALSNASGAAASSAAGAAYAPALLAMLRGSASASSAVSGMRQFTTGSVPCFSLAKTLGEELSFEKEQYQKPEQISSGPPAPFKLTDTPGDTLLTLTRQYNGEEINVDLHVNNQPSAPFDDGSDGEETLNFVAFNVSVSKGDTSLVFECESDGTSVNVNHVSCEPKDGIEQESAYTGPVFAELDDGLQKHFHAYLEDRGITAELGEYLRFSIYDKEQREYIAWLEKVRGFVGSS